jgi:hypothetical protein
MVLEYEADILRISYGTKTNFLMQINLITMGFIMMVDLNIHPSYRDDIHLRVVPVIQELEYIKRKLSKIKSFCC